MAKTRVQFIPALLLLAAVLPAGEPGVLTPPPSPQPKLHNARVYGVRPGHPFLYTIPATGARPLTFSARGLPKGLKLDARTGLITGVVGKPGTYTVKLSARNSAGADAREWRIVAGERLALTPPMGWSTWYNAHTAISDAEVRAQTDAMVSTGLIDHGYSYINLDDGWNIKPGSNDPLVGGAARDENGNLRPNRNFPDMKALSGYVHGKGLKIGIYISPGPLTCAGFAGSYQHEEQDARQFAAWDFDFLKYDLCSYGKLIKDRQNAQEYRKPYELMGNALRKLDRDFVYNFCEYGLGKVWEWGRDAGGNFWRTAGDVGGTWANVTKYGFGQAGMERWAGPGGWNDPDNINIGYIMGKSGLGLTTLTHNEQYTWMSLWSLMSAPLVFGGDMTRMDDFTLNVLTNDEVIAIDQDPLGKQAARVSAQGDLEVWAKDLEDGSKAAGLFNRGDTETAVTLRWRDISIQGPQAVRDLWRQTDMGLFEEEFTAQVGRHGVALIKLTPARRVNKPL
jgi:alpha-galactosidase